MIDRLSLHARLLLVAAVTGLAALAFAAFGIGQILEGFVMRGVDERLDTQIAILARAVTPDGRLDMKRVVELPGFADSRLGWGWRVRGPGGEWSGGAPVPTLVLGRPHHRDGAPRPGEAHGQPTGRLHGREIDLATPAGTVEISAAAPRRIIDRPLRAAMGPLLLSLGLLALGLAVATWLQLRLGLRPLRTLRLAVAEVRTGGSDRLPVDQPAELKPLVDEVNGLIDQNRAGLEHARRHLSNLAHGLKTPLATLSMRLEREEAPAETRALADQLGERIAHHLRRARSGASAGGQRARTPVSEVAADLVGAVGRVHADRAIDFDLRIDPSLWAAVDRQDLDEMLGNLLDNSARHAGRQVRVSAGPDGAGLRIDVEDDGSGMSEAEQARALRPGERLDESGIGYGFGLSIVQEVSQLYGGGLELDRSEGLGGLLAVLRLPRRA